MHLQRLHLTYSKSPNARHPWKAQRIGSSLTSSPTTLCPSCSAPAAPASLQLLEHTWRAISPGPGRLLSSPHGPLFPQIATSLALASALNVIFPDHCLAFPWPCSHVIFLTMYYHLTHYCHYSCIYLLCASPHRHRKHHEGVDFCLFVHDWAPCPDTKNSTNGCSMRKRSHSILTLIPRDAYATQTSGGVGENPTKLRPPNSLGSYHSPQRVIWTRGSVLISHFFWSNQKWVSLHISHSLTVSAVANQHKTETPRGWGRPLGSSELESHPQLRTAFLLFIFLIPNMDFVTFQTTRHLREAVLVARTGRGSFSRKTQP